MKVLLQRVTNARVEVSQKTEGKIGKGFVVFLGIGKDDNENDIEYLVQKIIHLRIFEDSQEKMNLSLKDIGGEILLVSQFTLYADIKKGRRPSFENAAPPAFAEKLYNRFIDALKQEDIHTETGIFKAYMQVSIHNDGPVTIMIDSKDR